MYYKSCVKNYGGVAQLARAFGSYPKGRGFDSLRRYNVKRMADSKVRDFGLAFCTFSL